MLLRRLDGHLLRVRRHHQCVSLRALTACTARHACCDLAMYGRTPGVTRGRQIHTAHSCMTSAWRSKRSRSYVMTFKPLWCMAPAVCKLPALPVTSHAPLLHCLVLLSRHTDVPHRNMGTLPYNCMPVSSLHGGMLPRDACCG
jgi:hypothetical protein